MEDIHTPWNCPLDLGGLAGLQDSEFTPWQAVYTHTKMKIQTQSLGA